MAVVSNNVDCGWAWLILVACCFIEFLHNGLIKSLSVLLPSLTDQFQTHTWIVGLSITSIGSVKDFSCKLCTRVIHPGPSLPFQMALRRIMPEAKRVACP